MKTKHLFLNAFVSTCAFLLCSSSVFAQGTWTRKADFGGTGRQEAISFSIGTKGYLGTGSYTQDFWEWNQGTDTWTQKADFGGTPRSAAACFVVGTKGYIGTGLTSSSNVLGDFWEWDQTSNIWTQKANFGGGARCYSVGYSIGGKGYIGAGPGQNPDYWEYDPAFDTWTQKASMSGTRYQAVAFTIGNKAYVGTGQQNSKNDFWEWDQVTDSWSQKADFPGTGRYAAASFSIGNKGYIGTGFDNITGKTADCWEWNQISNSWTQIADFGGAARAYATGFSIGTKGYIGTGYGTMQDFWEWYSLTVSTTSTNQNCSGNNDGTATATVSGGAPPFTYDWSNNGSTINISGLTAGTYTVVVSDATGYTVSATATVLLSPSINATFTTTPVSCHGGTNGTASMNVTNGTPPYTYGWPNGQTTQMTTGLLAGSYTSSVTDANGCIISGLFSIIEPTALTLSKSVSHASCKNSDGGISVNPGGGTPPYSFLWNNGSSTNTISNIPSGIYSVTITDSKGCSISNTVKVNNAVSLNPIPICMVTVDSTNKNLVVWEKPLSPLPIDSFRIYRQISSVYKHIASVSYSALSTFRDITTGVNPNIASYNYEISVIDTCGNESSLSANHKTIHLAISPASPCGYNLTWNDYIGFSITQYLVYRDSAKTGWKLVDSLSFGNTAWTDPTCYSTNDTIAYFIEAINPAGCNPSIKNPKLMTISSTRSNRQQNLGGNSVIELSNSIFTQVFPNPSKGNFVLEIQNKDGQAVNGSIEIYNMIGLKIYQSTVNSLQSQIEISSQPGGIYFVKIISEAGGTVQKIVIEK